MYRTLLPFFLLLPLSAQILVNTYAGGAIPSGVSAQSAFLRNVSGLAWDASGNLVFCDSVNNVIRRVNAGGTIETIAGTGIAGFAGDGGPAVSATLSSPANPSYDAHGNLYFSDSGNNRIRRIDAHGNIATLAGNGIAFAAGMDAAGPGAALSLDHIFSLAADGAGDVYFTEPYRIRRIAPSGQVSIYAGTGTKLCNGCPNGDGGSATATALSGANDLTVDPAGDVFFLEVVGSFSSSIRKITPGGIISTFLPPIFPAPPSFQVPLQLTGLAADSAGNIYTITGEGSNVSTIVRYDPNANPTPVAGGTNSLTSSPDGPALPSKISPVFPYSLAVDAKGNLGFVDSYANALNLGYVTEIREVTTQATLKTLAGANPLPSPDGTALKKAWFLSPTSIAFDQAGDLYVADTLACQIRKITPGGVLSTFAGTGTCGSVKPSGNAKTADLIYPASIAVDSHNNVWVADDFLNLYAIAQDGTISLFPTRTPVAGGTGLLAFDSKDRLYVAALDSLVRILPDLSVQTIVPTPTGAGPPPPGFLQVNGLGTDAARNVYFDSGNTIYRINEDGSYSQAAQNLNGTNGSFAVDAAGSIWQLSSSSVTVTSASGAAFLGTGVQGIFGDGGPAASAGFGSATDVPAFSPDGSFYFIDGSRIRVFTGSGPATPPIVSPGGIVNAANYSGGAIAPGELVSIFGSNFAPPGVSIGLPQNNALPTALGRTRVLFNGQPGAITAVTPNQINVFVPYVYNVIPGSPAQVQVQVDATLSAAMTVPVADSAPGIFTLSASGSGQGAILNQDNSINSSSNPAAAGSFISIYGTGQGPSTPQIGSGSLTLSTPYPAPAGHASVMVGNAPAQVTYTGSAPTLPAGVFQINAQIPVGTASGNVPVSVLIGTNGSGSQVTVAVR